MQFQYNADYPGDTEPRPPLDFPSAQPIPCARLKTRIIHNSQSIMAEPVLVRTVSRRRQSVLQHIAHDADDASMASSSSSSSSSSSNSNMDDGPPSTHPQAQQQQTTTSDCAYWIQRTVREAIYGRVLFAVVLKKGINGVWESTNQHCAIKELSWQHIRRERDRLAEDPIKEVSAMQYLKEWIASTRRIPDNGNNGDPVASSFEYMLHTNIMMPLDLLSDERYLYSIMPYCNGGELFELLDMNERFSEPEARYWMTQVLNGLENLQHAGICHRDMSLENLLVHESGALIIDMGMCLRIPYAHSNENIMTETQSLRSTQRHLLSPQGTCGKWIYMSPEILKNSKPFDGYAVDMWAAGVILFLMLTGFPPWDRAAATDERFRYMSGGYLVQMLTEWEIPISSDAMDLLQRMLFLDPNDRLSLDQVRAHPWMVSGPSQPPAPRPDEFR